MSVSYYFSFYLFVNIGTSELKYEYNVSGPNVSSSLGKRVAMDVILDQSVAMAVVLNSSSGDSRVISVWRGSRIFFFQFCLCYYVK